MISVQSATAEFGICLSKETVPSLGAGTQRCGGCPALQSTRLDPNAFDWPYYLTKKLKQKSTENESKSER